MFGNRLFLNLSRIFQVLLFDFGAKDTKCPRALAAADENSKITCNNIAILDVVFGQISTFLEDSVAAVYGFMGL